MMTINSKNEKKNDQGECLGWPVDSYGLASSIKAFLLLGGNLIPLPLYILLTPVVRKPISTNPRLKRLHSRSTE